MKMVVVGGNSRDIGKTSVMAGLIRALPQYQWTAIKLTQYGHGLCSVDGEECECAPSEHPFAVDEETDRAGRTDTSRFLAAGARRALWVRVRQGMLEGALPAFQSAIAKDEHVIVESNSILRFYRPNVYLTVLDPIKKDFKASAREFLAQADACLILEPGLTHCTWEGVSVDLLREKPCFSLERAGSLPPEIAAFVEQRLGAAQNGRARLPQGARGFHP